MENRKNWQPLIYTLLIASGIVLGMLLQPSRSTSQLWSGSGNKLTELLQLIEQVYVDTVNTTELEELAITKMLAELDPHSVYLPVDELKRANEQLEGNFEGIGVEFNILNDTIMVITPIEGGPSKELGILPGDRIIQVNDTTVAGVGIDNEHVFKLLRGPKGSKVKVTIFRYGAPKPIHYTITRGTIPVNSVDVAFFVDEHTGFIKVSRFASETHTEFEKALYKLKQSGNLQNLIIDVRGNGGGYLSAVIEMVDQLLDDKKLIVYTEGRNQSRFDYACEKPGLFESGRLVILIDEGSASASEILAGAVQDHDRGLIIGRRSFGKGLVQEPFQLKDGSGLRITVSRYYTPSGRCIQKPYDIGNDAYEQEIYDRFENGELEDASQHNESDTIKYFTKNGRTVFAKGGISPDIFVAIDTTYRCNYLSEVLSLNLLNQFASSFTDQNRSYITSFSSPKTFQQELKRNLTNEFVLFAAARGASRPNAYELNKVNSYLDTQLKALIARQVWRDEGYYTIISTFDKSILTALESFNNYDSILNIK